MSNNVISLRFTANCKTIEQFASRCSSSICLSSLIARMVLARILIILDDMHQIYEPKNRASFLADPTINPILEQEPNCSIVSQLAVCPLLRSPAHHPNSPLLSSPPPTMSIFSGRPSTITTGGDYKVTYQARGKLIDKAVPCHRRD